MADKRKLQAEIDRVLKRIQEGTEEFEGIWEKVVSAPNTNLKEKYEGDLKKEIKKLQRLRDQIKTWLTSNEVKDKKVLLDNRKLIESQMERFRAIERETKTKAYSKEGLEKASKTMDPAEREKAEERQWLNDAIDKLGMQVDAFEAELETLASTSTKKKGTSERTAKMEGLVVRHKFHINKLEQILRLMENDSLDVETIKNAINEDIDFYIENNQEDDYTENEALYEDLNLDENYAGDDFSDDDGDDDDDDDYSSRKEETKPAPEKPKAKEEPPASPSKPKQQTPAAAAAAAKPAAAATPAAAPTSTAAASTTAATTAAKGKDSAKGAAATTATTTPAAAAGKGILATPASSQGLLDKASAVPTATPAATTGKKGANSAGSSTVTTPVAAPVVVSPFAPPPAATPSGNAWTQQQAKKAAAAAAAASAPPTPAVAPVSPAFTPAVSAAPAKPAAAPAAAAVEEPSSTAAGKKGSGKAAKGAQPAASTAADAPSTEAAATTETTTPVSTTPILQPTATPQHATGSHTSPLGEAEFSNVSPLQSSTPATAADQSMDANVRRLAQLWGSMHYLPEPADFEHLKSYAPRSPATTAPFNPHTPINFASNPALFSKFDLDTLFFIFYFQQGTYQQYLAARELKKQAWRFHKKYLTWFQRHAEPTTVIDEFEQGTYVYFDYETGWCQRKKSEFTFEYRYLEDQEMP
ncbi:CCR4-NOT transcription complex subunit 3 [Capsaspora owczarzaki ATCC 30864]|uniref:CCR4-NOT transcription complex subunit 3 n=1 Tax=Capsaspora owczarzaki (strain ATCC 30864) TaxID=595528 RepID=A0A0D2UDH7_CAPO3|nr:CCR4-NOT transcription complex subunit 3 [Capsaspora owczarzaki ATCC 30864]KJE93086.1 CCR4-NOT transcription complex subunit 3 [Capsaspora owczarzaki ATCC 30864]|eukprot:XP_004363657.2 CCR4-NOT transcription complex subunit 3 [Capsaspora owczarzaki ATCC 30864]